MEFFSQKELAERWRCSDTKIKNIRRKGLIPHLQLADSNRYIYPVQGIIEYEQFNLKGGDKVRKILLAPQVDKNWRAS